MQNQVWIIYLCQKNLEKIIKNLVYKTLDNLLISKDKKMFKYNYEIYMKKLQVPQPVYIIYLKSIKMILSLFYNKIFNNRLNDFKIPLNWLKNS